MKKKEPLRQWEVSKLVNDSKSNIKDKSLSEGWKNDGIVPGSNPHINNAVQPQLSGSEWDEKIAQKLAAKKAMKSGVNAGGGLAEEISHFANKLRGPGKKLMGAVPVLGGLAQAAMTGDVMAAIPGLDSTEDVGLNSDIVDNLQNEEALMNIPSENFADQDVSEQARRWQKIRSLMQK